MYKPILQRFSQFLSRVPPTSSDAPPDSERRALGFSDSVAFALSRASDGVSTAARHTQVSTPQGLTPGIELREGERLSTAAFDLHPLHRIELQLKLASASGSGLSCLHVSLMQGPICLARFSQSVAGGAAEPTRCWFEPSLAAKDVFLELHREGSGEAQDSNGLVVTQLLVASPEELGLANGRNDYALRLKTEVGNFAEQSYTHSMYGAQRQAQGSGKVEEATVGEQALQANALAERERLMAGLLTQLACQEPAAGESVNAYAHRLLGASLALSPPNFFARLAQVTERLRGVRPARVLSICAGAARIEQQMLAHAQCAVELTLHDASPVLIQRAADGLAGTQWAHAHSFKCLLGDVNLGLPGDERFDVILCVSAMHHVVELEKVLVQVNERLVPGGEFWSIGEQIGRNGNRLWPDTLAVCNEAMASLPAKYRKNAHTGNTDLSLPDTDFSTGCFEGIRSEDIEGLLGRYLVPVDEYKRNCFLWRLVEVTYGDNFDLANAEDLAALQQLVAIEAMHWAAGGRSTELHGVYKKRGLAPTM